MAIYVTNNKGDYRLRDEIVKIVVIEFEVITVESRYDTESSLNLKPNLGY